MAVDLLLGIERYAVKEQRLTRLQKKRRRRRLRAARKELVRAAGHVCLRAIPAAAWPHICAQIKDWVLPRRVKVPRALRARLGKTVGGPWSMVQLRHVGAMYMYDLAMPVRSPAARDQTQGANPL